MTEHSPPLDKMIVYQDGLGKAGRNLHGNMWDQLGVKRIGHDKDEARRTDAIAAGILVDGTSGELPELLDGRPLTVYDNTTSTGQHASSTATFLDKIQIHALQPPKAYLLEKPVISHDDERASMEDSLERMGAENVFVNENYLALKAVSRGQEIIEQMKSVGVSVEEILIHFVKDRVPNVVLDNRFTDTKGLAVYGIEMPHQLAVASALLGEELDTSEGGSVTENHFLHDIDGIEQSEGNVTVLRQNDVTVTLRQGLGPFDFDDSNRLIRREYDWKTNEADRYALVRFSDGSTLRLTFDPVPGLPRYNSHVELNAANPALSFEESFEDNSLKNLMGAVAEYAASDQTVRSPILDNIGPKAAIRYAEQLKELRSDAGEPESVGPIDGDTEFADDYTHRLQVEKTKK